MLRHRKNCRDKYHLDLRLFYTNVPWARARRKIGDGKPEATILVVASESRRSICISSSTYHPIRIYGAAREGNGG